MTKPFLAALSGTTLVSPPIWLMRQAGRYLPEYRAVRARAGGFLDLCYHPEWAAEVTLQPIRRFGLDAAILFSDILVVPHAMGCKLDYLEGEGPKLNRISTAADLDCLTIAGAHERLESVYQTVERVRQGLPEKVALIGFAGGPWTVACYMVEGGGSRDWLEVKQLAARDPALFQRLIDGLVEVTINYLSAQVSAGAEAVQVFDTWAGVLPESGFRRWVIEPTRAIVSALRQRHPGVPVIGFPRGAGVLYEDYVRETGVNAVSLDSTVPVSWAAAHLQTRVTVQGNLDPVALLAGGETLVTETNAILHGLGNGPLVFNLGHGIIKETPPEHVELLIKTVRDR
ncbi:Uroporphyrinogen decarboxylase [uncultured Gammaproteobacteria bacterium]